VAVIYSPVIEIILNGIELGIVLTFLVGPVFFTIIQTSIERGFGRGVLVAIGVSLSDILYVAICYLGFAQVLASTSMKVYMAYAGGAILIGFGIYHLLFKSRATQSGLTTSVTEKRFYRYVIKGFLINGMTPMVLFFWIGTVSLATINFGYSGTGQFVLFFAALLITVLTTDILKAYLADKLRMLLTARSMQIMNIGLGLALIFFGAQLIYHAKTISLH
jgi:threonine/homoserine/homoserine lactone efflux protein